MALQTGVTKRKIVTVERARRLRKAQTVTEMLLWRELRDRRLQNLKFRRQVPIGPFIVDFYCAEKKLIIELDGFVHEDQEVQIQDHRRERFIRDNGYRVLRFTNDEANDDMEKVLRTIRTVCSER